MSLLLLVCLKCYSNYYQESVLFIQRPLWQYEHWRKLLYSRALFININPLSRYLMCSYWNERDSFYKNEINKFYNVIYFKSLLVFWVTNWFGTTIRQTGVIIYNFVLILNKYVLLVLEKSMGKTSLIKSFINFSCVGF